MQLVIYTIIFFILIGGIGMYFGNRKVDSIIARQRWLKYVLYILITSAVVISIWLRFFLPVAVLIVLVGYFELIRTVGLSKQSRLAIIIYTLFVAGFIFYAWKFTREFKFFIYLQILSFDAFSQVTGQLVGRSLIAPRISPTKTVEGFLGGLFFCLLASLLTSKWMKISLLTAIMFGLFTAIAGFAGDMLASYYKRIVGIKDYSNFLPGQGGFLDRFDGFLVTAFCYCVVSLIAPNVLPA